MTRTSRLAAVGILLLLIALAAGYVLGRTSAPTAGPSTSQGDSVVTPPTSQGSGDIDPDLVTLSREAIEAAYPKFSDFEAQPSFAGRSVVPALVDGDYYFAYLVHGSGVPIAQATCFRVDRVGRVFETGVFPDPLDSYIGYRRVDPQNCRGIG